MHRKMTTLSKKIVIRVDGGQIEEIGTGHIIRMIALAKSLITDGHQLFFITRKDKNYKLGYNLLSKDLSCITKGFFSNNLINNSQEEVKLILSLQPDIVIFDRFNTEKEVHQQLQSNNIKTISFEDRGSGLSNADLIINAIFDDMPKKRNTKLGFQYLILPKTKIEHIKEPSKDVKNISICMGGYDNRSLLKYIINNIPHIDTINYRYIIGDEVVYKNFANENKSKNIFFLHRPRNFHEIISDTDIAISAGGLTLFEYVSMGIPTIAIPQYEHQLANIDKLVKLKASLLGSNRLQLNATLLKDTLSKLIKNFDLRKELHQNAIDTIDRKGLKRVNKAITNLL